MEGALIKLTHIPVVRRLDYLDSYLQSIHDRLSQEELEVALADIKRGFEREKIMAVGRGNPYRKGIEKTSRLASYCKAFSKKLFFIVSVFSELRLTERGIKYIQSKEDVRKRMLCEFFSMAYPHLGVLVSVLMNQATRTVTLPLQNKPPFRPLAMQFGLDIGQVAFDTLRDLATGIGVVNWYYSGVKLDRRQHVYLTCHISESEESGYRVMYQGEWIDAVPNDVDESEFKKVLYGSYLDLTEGVPGSPVFYSALREIVCYELRINDRLFDSKVLGLVERDSELVVVWSEGVLPYLQDSAGMLKSLPPKTDYGNYIVYLKIKKRR